MTKTRGLPRVAPGPYPVPHSSSGPKQERCESPMDVFEAIGRRRSIKKFTDRAPTREEIERLLEAAVQAPNHRMTEPWRFYVLGPKARWAYGEALGRRKAKRVEAPEAAELVVQKVAGEHQRLPAMLAVAIIQHENPEIQEEDYASALIAVQNLSLAAVSMGLGAHIKTGGVMADPAARAAVDVADDERIVAIVNLGEPAEVPEPKERKKATQFTSWVD